MRRRGKGRGRGAQGTKGKGKNNEKKSLKSSLSFSLLSFFPFLSFSLAVPCTLLLFFKAQKKLYSRCRDQVFVVLFRIQNTKSKSKVDDRFHNFQRMHGRGGRRGRNAKKRVPWSPSSSSSSFVARSFSFFFFLRQANIDETRDKKTPKKKKTHTHGSNSSCSSHSAKTKEARYRVDRRVAYKKRERAKKIRKEKRKK